MTVLVLGMGVQSAQADHSLLELVTPGEADLPAEIAGHSGDARRVLFFTDEALVPADEDAARDLYAVAGGPPVVLTGGEDDVPVDRVLVSADATRAFFTTAERLSAADTDDAADVYESAGGGITLLSDGGDPAVPVGVVAVSRDGSRVLMLTDAKLTAEDTDAESDLYLRQGGATKLVSTGPSGGNGLFDTQFEGLSPDGTQVYFSTDESLVPADPDDVSRDLYVREGDDTRLLSTGPTATSAPFAQGFGAAMEGVAFFSTQEALVAEDQDEASDVYRYEDGVATLVSTGTEDLFAAYRGASEDGEVVFFSTVEQLAAADDDAAEDIYARRGATTTLVSTGPEAGGDHFAELLATTPDGSHAYFQTDEGLVAADDDGAPDIYERAGGVTTLVTTGPVTTSSPEDFEKFAVSDDGSRAFFVTQEQLVPGDLDGTVDLYERSAGKTTLITPGGDDAEYELAGLSADRS